jgi:hypothetical protein
MNNGAHHERKEPRFSARKVQAKGWRDIAACKYGFEASKEPTERPTKAMCLSCRILE